MQASFRSSPPRPLPSAIDSPDYEVSEGTRVWVFCPVDGEPICQGTIMLRIAGRIFGPIRFRVRQGRERAFHLTDREFGWDENNSVAAFITLRLRDPNGRLIRIQESMSVLLSPINQGLTVHVCTAEPGNRGVLGRSCWSEWRSPAPGCSPRRNLRPGSDRVLGRNVAAPGRARHGLPRRRAGSPASVSKSCTKGSACTSSGRSWLFGMSQLGAGGGL